MFETLFGTEQLGVRFLFAFIIVLALIAGATWVVRRFGASRLGAGSGRGRQPRLAVIDAASVDGRRRLVLIRRDNVEHLLMIGGPTDLVVEPNIVRAMGAPREATAPRLGDALPRPVPLAETMWPLQPQPEPPPAPPPRPVRAAEPFGGLVEEYSRTTTQVEMPVPPARPIPPERIAEPPRMAPEPPRVVPEPRVVAEPPRAAPESPRASVAPPVAAPERHATPASDQNLSEMAQRLESALRRPGPAAAAEPPPAPPLPSTPMTDTPQRAEESGDKAEPPEKRKSLYESLEQEMASLLGRPTNKK
jgi:hypothetical protein